MLHKLTITVHVTGNGALKAAEGLGCTGYRGPTAHPAKKLTTFDRDFNNKARKLKANPEVGFYQE